MGKTINLFKKIRDIKGAFYEKNGHNKGQKWYGPKRSEDTKKTWQEYIEELYKKRSS